MTKYAIATPDLFACSFGPGDRAEVSMWYRENKKKYTDPDSAYYGHVLVETKPMRTGFDVDLSFNWHHIDWESRFEAKYIFKLEWLGVSLQCRWQTYESAKHGEVIKDWLSEQQAIKKAEWKGIVAESHGGTVGRMD